MTNIEAVKKYRLRITAIRILSIRTVFSLAVNTFRLRSVLSEQIFDRRIEFPVGLVLYIIFFHKFRLRLYGSDNADSRIRSCYLSIYLLVYAPPPLSDRRKDLLLQSIIHLLKSFSYHEKQ